jgi:hypothetical protein
MFGDLVSTNPTNTQWNYARVRAYPPNGVMPYVTFDFPAATGNNFQQMINITESSFSSYLTYNSNFANFEYSYANGTIIPSWIESNNSGKLVTWAKLSKSIHALSNATIYLGFAGSNNLLSSSGTSGIGEAPQLPCGNTATSSCPTYAEYDDGAKVFNEYWNFAGTTLPSTLSANNTGAGYYTINNGITISSITTGHGWMDIQSIQTFNPQTEVIDGEGNIIYTSSTSKYHGGLVGYGTTNPNGDASAGNIGFGILGSNSVVIGCWNLTSPININLLDNYISGTNIISSAYATSAESFGSVNYNSFISKPCQFFYCNGTSTTMGRF